MNEVEITRNHYEWLYEGSYETIGSFKRLTNWLSGEFMFYQQERLKELTIFFLMVGLILVS